MPSTGGGTVVVRGGGVVVVVVPEGAGGSEGVGLAPAVERLAGEVATEAVPAPMTRRRRVTTTIHEVARPGTRIHTSPW